MANDHDPDGLAEWSRHYDSMLWTVTSLWAAAVGGVLLYSVEHFDPWVAAFGLALTVCAMFFAYSFRKLRRRVHADMPDKIRGLVIKGRGLRQWDMFLLIFMGLVFLWGRLLIRESCGLWPFWLVLTLIAGGLIVSMWARERWAA